MAQTDPTIKVYGHQNKMLLWEENDKLSENEDFVEQFKMYEQTFRTGNKKVTMYCNIEYNDSINKIKFTEPVRSLLMEKNVWIKPDFYSIKTVSNILV